MLDYFFPQTVANFSSLINGKISVVKSFGQYKVLVGTYEQSGPWVHRVWQKALKTIPAPSTVLILGLGTGVVARFFPHSQITGVEIDPVMLQIGGKYFHLSELTNLKVITGDAVLWLKATTQTFDLILVDVYLGKSFPASLNSPEFLRKLSHSLSQDGRVVFNRLTIKNGDFVREEFIDKLQKFFKIDTELKIEFNTFLFCSKR